jgi:hypothetical protein
MKCTENFQGKKPKWPKTHEEMLNLPGHKGNANQNYIKIPAVSCQNGYHQEHKKQQMLVSIWGERNPHTLLVGSKLL